MSDYQAIVDTIRETALEALEGTGRFINGRVIDASQAYDGAYPLIVNYPFIITDGTEGTKNASILMGFWQQDSLDYTPLQREAVIAAMDELQQAFWNILIANTQIGLSGKRAEPQYQTLSATLSGFALSFTLQIKSEDEC